MNSTIILAQVGSSELDFLRQIPGQAIMTLCLSGVALIVALVFIVRARTQRSQQAAQSAAPTLAARPMMPVTGAARAPSSSQDDLSLDDLPDLDLLVDAPKSPPTVTAPVQSSAQKPPARIAPKGTYTVHVRDGEAAEAVEVVTILRDVTDGSLIIQMGDKIYRDLNSDEAFKGRFLTIMRELAPMVTQASKSKPPAQAEKPPQTAPAPEASEPVPMPTATDTTSLRDLLAEEDEPEPPTAAPPPPPTPDGRMPGDLPRFSLDEKPQVIEKRSGLLGRTKKEFVPVPEFDLAGAIEAYLQHKLRHLPDYSGRSIHVHPSPDGGVAIEVDGQYYDAVGDVDDKTVRTLLSQTIQEWQERNTNG